MMKNVMKIKKNDEIKKGKPENDETKDEKLKNEWKPVKFVKTIELFHSSIVNGTIIPLNTYLSPN